MLTIPLFAITLLIVVLLILMVAVIYYKKVSRQLTLVQTELSSNQLFIDELQLRLSTEIEQQQHNSDEIRDIALEGQQVSKQLEHRIKTLQQQHQQLETLITQIEQQQPEDKLYSRASKMVELGADVEEIMRECEIPRAEAEMLLSVHRSRLNN